MPNEKDGSKAVSRWWERVYTRMYEGRVNHSDLDLGRMRIKPPTRWILRGPGLRKLYICTNTYVRMYIQSLLLIQIFQPLPLY